MGITERIKRIGSYFKEMQIVTVEGNKQVIYVIVSFPYEWVIDNEIEKKYNVTVGAGNYNGEYYFCSEIENGEEVIFDAIEYNIEKMKEAIERARLLSEKTMELRKMFENEDITLAQLRSLKITYDNETKIVVTKKIDEDAKNKPEEVKSEA
jgi:uncharacterized protein (UPF0333 family)